MKKKKWKIILVILAVILLAAGGVAVMGLLRSKKVDTMVRQQNYVASKLMEMGEYEQGRILAAQSNQTKENMVSKQLMVLAAGLQNDYDAGIRYADSYLAVEEDSVLSSAKEIYQSFLEKEKELDADLYQEQCYELMESTRQEVLVLLLQVQNSIDIKKNSENIQAMLTMLSDTGFETVEGSLAILQSDNSAISKKVQTAYAIQTGDYNTAFEKAEALFKESQTFESRAMLANITAQYGAYLDGEDEEIQALRQELSELDNKLYDLQRQYDEVVSETEKRKLDRQMESMETRIREKQDEINAVPTQRAINFIETTTPVIERATVAYKVELAQLYYQANNKEKSKELLLDLLKGGNEDTESAAVLFEDLLQAYLMMSGKADKPSYLENIDISVYWNRIAELLGFIDNTYYNSDNASFYGYVLGLLDELYNGIIIREIDATDFPTVRVTVNVVMELEKKLEKSNFTLTEMGGVLNNFELLDTADLKTDGDMSVALVVDRSGSMGGTRMEDTKKAVSSFVKNTDSRYNIGLVTFDDSAQTVVSLTTNKNAIIQAVQAVTDGGGTSIYSGLQEAGNMLGNAGGRKIVILLSDGEDGDTSRIDAVLDELNRRNIYVYTIGVGGADTEYLSYIASKCGGKFIQADSSGELSEIYNAIGEYMKNDYVIEFTIELEPDNFTRVVNVSVDVNDAFAEKEYYVGVPYDAIESEQEAKPVTDYFRQVGGSAMDSQ